MLVVPGLVWPMLLGENHLHATQALVIDHYVPAITFRYPRMQFRAQCFLDNPFKGFNSVLATNASLSQESGETASKPRVSVTCLLTRALPAGLHKRSQHLHRGFNIVTVCVTLPASLMGFQKVGQPLWIEGKQIQPGVKVLSGPRDLSQISIHGAPDTNGSNSDLCYKTWLVKHQILF